jgi:hypothetical protein
VTGQATLHQRKAQQRRSISPIAQVDKQHEMETWIEIVDSVDLTRANHPEVFGMPAFQVGSFDAMMSVFKTIS